MTSLIQFLSYSDMAFYLAEKRDVSGLEWYKTNLKWASLALECEHA